MKGYGLSTGLRLRIEILSAFIRKEILQVLRDKRMRIVLFVAPMMQLMIFGIALSNETRNVKIAYWGNETDRGVKDLYQHAISSKWFIPAKPQGDDPFEWVQSGEADVVLVGGAQDLLSQAQNSMAKLQLLINAQNSMRAQSIESYLKAISSDVLNISKDNGAINLSASSGIKFEVRSLYNPTFETSLYMVPGVMSMLVCLVTILLTSMSVAREKEAGTIETLTASPLDSWDLLLGKTVPFIMIGAIQAPLILAFAVFAFGLPVRGPFLMLTIASLLMIVATVAIGLLISTISRNQQQAMLGGFMYLFPSYLLSGLMFPIENMPLYFQPFAYINPLTHYMGLLRNILLVGGETDYFVRHSVVLVVMAVLVGSLALNRFRKMLV